MYLLIKHKIKLICRNFHYNDILYIKIYILNQRKNDKTRKRTIYNRYTLFARKNIFRMILIYIIVYKTEENNLPHIMSFYLDKQLTCL